MPPKHVLKHLELREGRVNRVYLDSEDNPTAGVGHLLSEEECAAYKVGSEIPADVIDAWLEEDASKAWLAAFNQCNGIRYHLLQEALFHLNFQLGAAWPLKFPKTWKLLKNHKFHEAAIEVALNSNGQYPSLWMNQTPLRVADFQIALLEQVV